MANDLFSGDGFLVTKDLLKTRRRTYELKNIEYISIHQPLLIIMGAIGLGLFLFTLSFFRYLYMGEIFLTISISIIAVFLAAKVGSLKVHSLALREGQTPIFGNMATLHKVKEAVESAISIRNENSTS